MAKHSFEFKKKVVLEYLDGKGGTQYLSKKYGLGSNSQLRKWINAYSAFGDEGLRRSRNQIKYSFKKKISVVELYLSSEISYQDLAIREGISNPSMIVNWVNRFRAAGPDALRPRKKGRKKTTKDNLFRLSDMQIEGMYLVSATKQNAVVLEQLKIP